MSAQLEGKVAIVTGSSSGLGEAIALMFASRGARVTLCGRDQERLRSVLDKAVKVSGGHEDRFITVQGDVTDQAVRKQIVDVTIEKHGRLDIPVANAGTVFPNDTIYNVTKEHYDKVMDTNLKSVFFLIQLAAPHLEKTKGNIVNISSITTYMANPLVMIYSMSKAGMDQLTKCLAVHLGAKGIRVNSVNPGFFPTLIVRNYGDVNEVKNIKNEDQTDKIPLSGRVAVVEDVAEVVAFLASDAAGFITGELIKVDGGRYSTGPFVALQLGRL